MGSNERYKGDRHYRIGHVREPRRGPHGIVRRDTVGDRHPHQTGERQEREQSPKSALADDTNEDAAQRRAGNQEMNENEKGRSVGEAQVGAEHALRYHEGALLGNRRG